MTLAEFLTSPIAELIVLVMGALVLAGLALLTLRRIVTVLVARERRRIHRLRMGTPGEPEDLGDPGCWPRDVLKRRAG